MSRIGINGIGARRIEEEDVFDFEALPEEESEGSPRDDEIDAINDETFGTDVSSLLIDDLEQYSKQTECLGLEGEEPPDWMNEPSCSVSAPDPSQLPFPPFDDTAHNPAPSAHRDSASYSDKPSHSSSYELKLGTLDSLWRNAPDSTVWTTTDLKSTISRSAFNFVNKVGPDDMFSDRFNELRLNVSRPQQEQKPKPRILAAIPKGALRLEDVESEHLRAARCSSLPAPPVSTSEGATPQNNLERRIPFESSTLANIMTGSSNEKQGTTDPRMSAPPPPLPVFPFPFMHPFAANILRAHLMGQLPELPPGFPPIPPQMRAAFLATSAPGPMQRPPPPPVIGAPPPQMPSVMAPPFHLLPRPPILRQGHPVLPPHVLYPQQGLMGRTTNKCYREQRLKQAGLPSGKTISDFAFDPYAGFMSRKEREWLIKIQTLQCQGCGNPYEDDFYYTSWKQRQMASKLPSQVTKPLGADCDFSATASTVHHYVPPTFAGSLGKPTLSTANYPRQLIDLSNDSTEDEDRSNTKGTSQRKLRALLMMLEGVATLLIECDDRRRQLSSSVLPEEISTQLEDEIHQRLEAIISCICGERLPTVLVINKGRQMFKRTLLHAKKPQQLKMFIAFFGFLPAILKKVPADELNASIMSAVDESLSHLSKENVLVVVKSFSIEAAVAPPYSNDNSFFVNIVLSLLRCCAKRRCEIVVECSSSAFCSWLRTRKQTISTVTADWQSNALLDCNADRAKDMEKLRSWLSNQFMKYPGCMALQIAEKLPVAFDNGNV